MIARSALGPWLALTLLSACATPDDTLFTRPPVPPTEVAPGLFRVTWNPEPDVVRGFTPDGARIVFQSRDLAGFGKGWYVLSVGLADGAVREEAGIYRLALPDTTAHVVIGTSGRLLVTWHTVPPGGVTCGQNAVCPLPPAAIDVAVRRLALTDGLPISALPIHEFRLPNHATTAQNCLDGSVDPNGNHRIRIRPAEREIDLRRVNPFGPVELADGSAGFLSDGETVWRYDPADPAAPPDSLGPGAFPALSPDGRWLAVAVPLGLDSTAGQCQAGLCPCRQETVTITTTGWEVRLYDLASGGSVTLGAGLEPAFDPLDARVVVRQRDGLYWVTLATGEATPIAGTDGAYAPALSPDGTILAFTADRFDGPDVFFLRIR
jgi:hypothetical protein